MRVKELIELLQKVDGELEVRFQYVIAGGLESADPRVEHMTDEWAAVLIPRRVPTQRPEMRGATSSEVTMKDRERLRQLQGPQKERDDAGDGGRK